MNTITGRRNSVCVHLKKLGSSSSYRKQSGEFLCDGIKLLEEAVGCGAVIPIVLTSAEIPFDLLTDTVVYNTDLDIINSLSPLKQSQNVLFSCKIPNEHVLAIKPACVTGSHVLLDSLQDPGNVGTIIRTANALGIKSVMLYGDSADIYNPKVIRATMGAIFRQSVFAVTLDELLSFKDREIKIIGAALSDDCRDFNELSYENTIIAIGNEGSGLSQEILSLCDERIKIPISKESESLNAAIAAAIIMARARFQ